MLGKIPVMSLDDIGSINNINLLQLNNVFAKLYLNDLFYQKLYDKIPKVYQNNKIYNKNDCIWLNTEYYREFIDFPIHAKHIVNDYNSSPYGMVQSKLSLDYDELSNKIIISSKNGEEISKEYLDYDNKETCLSLMRYSYVVGDLTDKNGNINNSILYKCNFDNVSGWIDLNNETNPLKDRLSVYTNVDGNKLSVIRTLDECKTELNYERYTYPVWSVVYSNAAEINYGWVSAYVRSALSVHAMTISANANPGGGTAYVNPIPTTDALGRMPAFPGDSNTLAVSAYVPGYETNGYSISPINDTLLSISIKNTGSAMSADTKIGYFYKDIETREFNKALIYNDKTSSDNMYFLHNVPNNEQYDEIDLKYTSIETFNINLSTLWTCHDKATCAVEYNFGKNDALSNTFDCIICSSGAISKSSNINIWASGLVEAYGTNANYAAYLVGGADIGELGIRIRFNGLSAIQLTSSTNSETTYYVSEYLPISSLIPILSAKVPAVRNYVNDYLSKEDL